MERVAALESRLRADLERPDADGPVESAAAGRVLLRGVRHPQLAARLLRRPRRARGRHGEGGLRPRPAVRRRGADVPPGLLPPAHRRLGLAARVLDRHGSRPAAGRPGQRGRTGSRSRSACRWGRPRCRRASGAWTWAGCRSTCSTPTTRERRPRALDQLAPLRGRPRYAAGAVHRARRRRGARAARARHRAGHAAPQRGARGAGAGGARTRRRGRRRLALRRPGRGRRAHRLHHAHPGARRQRLVSGRAGGGGHRRPRRRAGHARVGADPPGSNEPRRPARAAGRHAAGAAPEPQRRRGEPPPRRGGARDVARAVAAAHGRRGPDRPRDERRARAHLGRRSDARAARPPPRATGGASAPTIPRPGPAWTRSQTTSCGRRVPSSAASSCASRASAASATAWGATTSPSTWRPRPAPSTPACSRSASRAAWPPTSGSACCTHDPERTLRLLGGERPVQVVLAGKAHPRDEEAKRVLQALFQLKGAPVVAERVIFLDDYDLATAARLVQGCDVWVNLPRPPLEASGTSGMKSAMNGGLQLSVLDGWWAEGADPAHGWSLPGDTDADHGAQDARDAAELYRLLEDEVVPAFYERDAAASQPPGWPACAPRCGCSGPSSAPRACCTTTWSARTGHRARRETHRRSVHSPRAGGARGNREESSARVTADPYSLTACRHGCSRPAGAAGRGRRPRHHRALVRRHVARRALLPGRASEARRARAHRARGPGLERARLHQPERGDLHRRRGAVGIGPLRRGGLQRAHLGPARVRRLGRDRGGGQPEVRGSRRVSADRLRGSPARGPARRAPRPPRGHGGPLVRRWHPARRSRDRPSHRRDRAGHRLELAADEPRQERHREVGLGARALRGLRGGGRQARSRDRH